MGKQSVKPNKNIYFQCREKLGLTREEAEERLEGITASRIEKIENDRVAIHPEDVLIMADGYKSPELCNYYCSNECPIGKVHVPEVKIKDLSQIILELVVSLNGLQNKKDQLMEITVDGRIENDEVETFVRIQNELERMSMTVDALRLWSEQMLVNGKIDIDLFNKYRNQ